ncbi:CHASE3 domain-containing protein, partial [Actinoplanes sp. Pm04-4]
MMAGRTFGTKLAAGFGLTLALTLLMTATSVAALRYVLTTKDSVITSARVNLVGTEMLSALMESRIADYRGYLLTGTDEYLNATNQDRANFLNEVSNLRKSMTDTESLELLDTVSAAEEKHAGILGPVMEQRARLTDLRNVNQLAGNDQVKAARIAVQQSIKALIARQSTVVDARRDESSNRATAAIIFIVAIGLLLIGAAAAVAWKLSRDLKREVGAAVGHI